MDPAYSETRTSYGMFGRPMVYRSNAKNAQGPQISTKNTTKEKNAFIRSLFDPFARPRGLGTVFSY